MENVHESVKNYYGEVLNKSGDLKTNACCTVVDYPTPVKKAMSQIHEEVHSKYYGCGLTIPTELEGLSVLDLGSGAGRDCYILSRLVGEKGTVVGVDMTPQQLEVANRHLDFHAKEFGYEKTNVRFVEGNIEKLDELDFSDNQFDLIVSNCVINLAEDKEAVLRQAFRLLKEGGEFYFSDVYVDRRVEKELVKDPVLYGECLSGALYWNDFQNLARKVGFADPRIVSMEPITISNKEVERKTKGYKFGSITYRLFKLKGLEPHCEDYGQAVKYLGTDEDSGPSFVLDDHHLFEAGKVMPVCGNTWMMLKDTRFQKHFEFYGDFSKHYGIFEGCGMVSPIKSGITVQESMETGCC